VRHGSAHLIALGGGEWILLCGVYHHVLAQSPSPEAAKIAISDARKNSKLRLRAELREYVARPDLKLQPGEKPPPLSPKTTHNQPIFPSDIFRTWDWEFSRATRTDPITNSLFEYTKIVAHRDDVLRTWPSVEMTMNTGVSETFVKTDPSGGVEADLPPKTADNSDAPEVAVETTKNNTPEIANADLTPALRAIVQRLQNLNNDNSQFLTLPRKKQLVLLNEGLQRPVGERMLYYGLAALKKAVS
jgi:hypothetical protein